MRTLHVSELRHRTRRLETSDGLDVLPGSIGASGEELLAASIHEAAGDGLAASDAAVLYATRVLGLPLVEVAEFTGVSVRRLGRQRNHAVAFVVA
jgi:DNA-directed RNA polymerase specialized sigma24 family protein